MINANTKVVLLSRQLDLLQNLCERLRTDVRIPIELRCDISEVMLKSRAMEKTADVGVTQKTGR